MSKIKNIIIFLAIGTAFVLIYIFFIKPSAPVATLVSSPSAPVTPSIPATENNFSVTQDFLNLLLNIKNIKLNDAIFSDNAFVSLHDSSIVLTPDGNEGRVNPFAALGQDVVVIVPPTCALPKVLNTLTNTCVNPSPN
jgi:hypothetical protein